MITQPSVIGLGKLVEAHNVGVLEFGKGPSLALKAR